MSKCKRTYSPVVPSALEAGQIPHTQHCHESHHIPDSATYAAMDITSLPLVGCQPTIAWSLFRRGKPAPRRPGQGGAQQGRGSRVLQLPAQVHQDISWDRSAMHHPERVEYSLTATATTIAAGGCYCAFRPVTHLFLDSYCHHCWRV